MTKLTDTKVEYIDYDKSHTNKKPKTTKINIKDSTDMAKTELKTTIEGYKQLIRASKEARRNIKKDIKRYKLMIKQVKITEKLNKLSEE